MTTEQNKALVRRFYEAFTANDMAALRETLAPTLAAFAQSGPDAQNREAHLQGISAWLAAFSSTRFEIEEQIAEGDKVATRVSLRAIHSRGPFQGLAPTGKEIVMSGTSIERIQDGKIVERHVDSDWFGLLQQLGLVPSPQPTR